MKSKLFWHVYSVPGIGEIVREQERLIRKMPASVELEVVVTGDHSIAPWLRELLCDRPSTVTLKAASEYEFDTIQELYAQKEGYDSLGYVHTKGATSRTAHSDAWRRFMGFNVIQFASRALRTLQSGFDTYGVFWNSTPLAGQPEYYAGNFWWATRAYLRRLPFPRVKSSRYDCELWIGEASPRRFDAVPMHVLTHMDEFVQISASFNTDKRVHGYVPLYQMYVLNRFGSRQAVSSLTEIGVFEGESLRMWNALFPRARIVGVDFVPKNVPFPVLRGDQADRNFLAQVPPSDIIIDDGGHRSRQQIISLVSLLPKSRLYVIEDLHTSLPELYDSYHEPGELTCLEYLKQYPALKPDYISAEEHARLAGYRIDLEQGVFSPIAFIQQE